MTTKPTDADLIDIARRILGNVPGLPERLAAATDLQTFIRANGSAHMQELVARTEGLTWADLAAAMWTHQRPIVRWFVARGWYVAWTGGGCRAWRRDLHRYEYSTHAFRYVMLTDYNAMLPETIDAEAVIGYFDDPCDADGNDSAAWNTRDYDSVREAMEACDATEAGHPWVLVERGPAGLPFPEDCPDETMLRKSRVALGEMGPRVTYRARYDYQGCADYGMTHATEMEARAEAESGDPDTGTMLATIQRVTADETGETVEDIETLRFDAR